MAAKKIENSLGTPVVLIAIWTVFTLIAFFANRREDVGRQQRSYR